MDMFMERRAVPTYLRNKWVNIVLAYVAVAYIVMACAVMAYSVDA